MGEDREEKDHPRVGDVYLGVGFKGELCLVEEASKEMVYVALMKGDQQTRRWVKTWYWRTRFSEDVRPGFLWTRVRVE